MNWGKRSSWIVSVSAMALLAAGSGCAMFRSDLEPLSIADELMGSPPPGMVNAPTAVVTVELRQQGRQPEIKKLELHQGMLVQQALVESGAQKRFRRMDIDLMRSINGGRHKLELKYDRVHKMVDPLYDYALHPGDHLVVVEDPANAFDDMMNAVAEPLGLPTAQGRR